MPGGTLRPLRGMKRTAINRNLLLKRGEIFFEIPETGIGTDTGKIKMGDGKTLYEDLPYFMDPATNGGTSIYANNAGSATNASTSEYAIRATNANTASYSNNSGTANYSKNASTATNASTSNYSKNAGTALYSAKAYSATNASTSTYSTKTATDTALSTTSTNPVQNKVVATEIGALKQSFQDGCNTISNKITELGVSTATNSSPIIIANNIEILANNKYNEGVENGGSAKTIQGTIPRDYIGIDTYTIYISNFRVDCNFIPDLIIVFWGTIAGYHAKTLYYINIADNMYHSTISYTNAYASSGGNYGVSVGDLSDSREEVVLYNSYSDKANGGIGISAIQYDDAHIAIYDTTVVLGTCYTTKYGDTIYCSNFTMDAARGSYNIDTWINICGLPTYKIIKF